jgi:hypothetical protein
VLRTFQDHSINDTDSFSDVTISLSPQKGSVQDFDFDLSFQKDNVGARSSNLAVEGKGQHKGSDFNFKADIKNLDFKYALGTKYNHDHEYDALVFLE